MDEDVTKAVVLRFIKGKGYPRGCESSEIHTHVARFLVPFRKVQSLVDKMVMEELLSEKEVRITERHRTAPFYKITTKGMELLKQTDAKLADKGEPQP